MKPLKVGDRVAVYGRSGNFFPIRGVGEINGILNDGEIIRLMPNDSIFSSMAHGGWDLSLVHRKQCRLLKPKVRLEIWLFDTPANGIFVYRNKEEAFEASKSFNATPIRYIEARDQKK